MTVQKFLYQKPRRTGVCRPDRYRGTKNSTKPTQRRRVCHDVSCSSELIDVSYNYSPCQRGVGCDNAGQLGGTHCDTPRRALVPRHRPPRDGGRRRRRHPRPRTPRKPAGTDARRGRPRAAGHRARRPAGVSGRRRGGSAGRSPATTRDTCRAAGRHARPAIAGQRPAFRTAPAHGATPAATAGTRTTAAVAARATAATGATGGPCCAPARRVGALRPDDRANAHHGGICV